MMILINNIAHRIDLKLLDIDHNTKNVMLHVEKKVDTSNQNGPMDLFVARGSIPTRRKDKEATRRMAS